MSETTQSETLVLPFFVADAWLERMTSGLNNVQLKFGSITTKRYQLSTGSTRIDVSFRDKKIGWFSLFAGTERITLFMAHTASYPIAQQIMPLLFNLFVPAFNIIIQSTIQSNEQLEALLQSIHDKARTTVTAVSEALPPESQEPQPPRPTDPVDAWLDWREAERKKGRRWTLTQLAQQSNWSESTFKKQSALRKPRGK